MKRLLVPLPWTPSRIGLRIFAFNLLVLVLPVAGILYLDVYERELLAAQERGMVQQARLVAAGLAHQPDMPSAAALLLGAMAARSDARIQVIARDGRVVADTAAFGPGAQEVADLTYTATASNGRSPGLYRAGAWIAQRLRAIAAPVRRMLRRGAPAPDEPLSGERTEIQAAFQGRYGAATRPTPGQRSLTLHSALPVVRDGEIVGAVVVSQSTWRILQALYEVRLRIFQVVVASGILAALLSAIVAATVVRPLSRLRRAAASLGDRRSALPGRFRGAERRDEIGDLARALEELTRRLDVHVRQVESAAADVSHELKNPLTSIRTAAEMIAVAEDPAERQRFLAMLTRDVDRLERLVSGVQEMARIDAQLAQEPPAVADLVTVVRTVVDGARLTPGSAIVFESATGAGGALVHGAPDRIAQVFENLVRNARSFSPPDAPVQVAVSRHADAWEVTVSDRGPGIPAEHLDRIFERFFSYRPGADPGRMHAGLGLAIAKAIVEGYGGTIDAGNQPDGGARFVVHLKAAGAPVA